MKRLENEKFEDYKKRRNLQEKSIKKHLKGKLIKVNKIKIPKIKFRKEKENSHIFNCIEKFKELKREGLIKIIKKGNKILRNKYGIPFYQLKKKLI